MGRLDGIGYCLSTTALVLEGGARSECSGEKLFAVRFLTFVLLFRDRERGLWLFLSLVDESRRLEEARMVFSLASDLGVCAFRTSCL